VARRFKVALLLLVALLVTTGAHRRLPRDVRAQIGHDYVPRPEFAKAMSLGFDTLLADYYWVQAVLLAGGSLNPQSQSTHLGRLIDVVTTLDPWVDHPYRFAAVWLTNTLDDVRLGNDLLRRSFPHHPDEWRNRFYLGFNLFYYLDENGAAADVLEEASSMTGAPRYLPRLVARLRSESADLGAAAIFLEELVRNAPDDQAKAEYQSALDEIEVEWRARELDRARAAYRKLHGRDIEFVEQLAMGTKAVLPRLPSAEPSSLPVPLRRGSRWEIDEASGTIVSTYYGRRYEIHIDEHSRRIKRELALRSQEARARGAASEGGRRVD